VERGAVGDAVGDARELLLDPGGGVAGGGEERLGRGESLPRAAVGEQRQLGERGRRDTAGDRVVARRHPAEDAILVRRRLRQLVGRHQDLVGAQRAGEGVAEHALDRLGAAELAQRAEQPTAVGRHLGALERAAVTLEAREVAVDGGEREPHLRVERVDRGRPLEEGVGPGASRLVDAGVAAQLAQREQQLGTRQRARRGLAGGRGEPDAAERRAERGTGPGGEGGLQVRAAEHVVHAPDAVHHGLDHLWRRVATEVLEQREVLGAMQLTGLEQCPGVPQQTDALAHVERVGVVDQRTMRALGQRPAVVPAFSRVGVQPDRVAARALEPDDLRLTIEQHALLADLCAVRPGESHRDLPADGRLGRRAAAGEEALLPQSHAAVAQRLGGHDRRPGLVDVRAERGGDVAARGATERRPQVRRDGVLPGVALDVVTHAAPRHLGPEPGFVHHQQRLALVVGERVGELVQVDVVTDRLAHRPDRRARVELQRLLAGLDLEHRDVELGEGLLRDLVADPRGERLVEPQVVPPPHGDQIAEPHVRHLVREVGDQGASLLGAGGGRVEQQRAVGEGDRPGVLHRPGPELGHRDQVELAVGVRPAEVALERRQDRRRRLGGVGRQVPGAAHRHHPARHRHALDRHGLEWTGGDRQQVARHRRGALEHHRAPRPLARLALDWRVRDRQVRRRHDQRHLPRDLELGLVPARERATCVDRLELGEGVGAAADLEAVEAGGAGVEVVGEVDLEHVGAGGERSLRADDHQARRAFAVREPDRAGRPAQRDPVELHLAGVEPERVHARGDGEVDPHRAGVVGARRVDLEADRFEGRRDRGPEAQVGARQGGGTQQGGDGQDARGHAKPPGRGIRVHPADHAAGAGSTMPCTGAPPGATGAPLRPAAAPIARARAFAPVRRPAGRA